jgi:hypothetical protein
MSLRGWARAWRWLDDALWDVRYAARQLRQNPMSYPDFVDWRAQAKSFEGMGAVVGWATITLKDPSGPNSLTCRPPTR